MKKPYLGAIVLYTPRAESHRPGIFPQMAAIVIGLYTEDNPESESGYSFTWAADLNVFNLNGQLVHERVPFSDEFKRGHWSWSKPEDE